MTAEAKAIYEAILEQGPLDKVRLRRAARLTSDSAKSRVDRCPGAEPRRTAGFCQGKSQRRWLFPVELQVGSKVLPVGVAEAGAWNYAFVYELFQRWFPQVPQQARSIGRAEARRVLVRQYLDNVVAADRKMMAKVFHVLKWTPKELERTIGALVEDGQARREEIEGLSGLHLISTCAF